MLDETPFFVLLLIVVTPDVYVCSSCRGNAHHTNCIVLVIAEFWREKNGSCVFILKLVCDQLGIKTMQLTLGMLFLSQNI